MDEFDPHGVAYDDLARHKSPFTGQDKGKRSMNRQRMYKLIGLSIGFGLFGTTVPVSAQTVTPFQQEPHPAC